MGAGRIPRDRIFYKFYKGKICTRTTSDNPEARSRVIEKGVNAGKTIYEEEFDYLSGKLKSIKWHTHDEYGVFMDITLWDEEEEMNHELSISATSNAFQGFCMRMENIDLEKQIVLLAGVTDENHWLIVQQKGEDDKSRTLDRRYTKENPEDCPPWEKFVINQKEHWDKTKQIEFFANIINNKIVPQLKVLFPETADRVNREDSAVPDQEDILGDAPPLGEDDIPHYIPDEDNDDGPPF